MSKYHGKVEAAQGTPSLGEHPLQGERKKQSRCTRQRHASVSLGHQCTKQVSVVDAVVQSLENASRDGNKILMANPSKGIQL